MGLLAAVSYAVKQYMAPKVSQWYHEWRNDADKAKAEEEQQKTAQLVAGAIQSQVTQHIHPNRMMPLTVYELLDGRPCTLVWQVMSTVYSIESAGGQLIPMHALPYTLHRR